MRLRMPEELYCSPYFGDVVFWWHVKVAWPGEISFASSSSIPTKSKSCVASTTVISHYLLQGTFEQRTRNSYQDSFSLYSNVGGVDIWEKFAVDITSARSETAPLGQQHYRDSDSLR